MVLTKLHQQVVNDIQFAIEIESCGLVMQACAGLTGVKQVECFLNRNVQTLSYDGNHSPDAIPKDDVADGNIVG
jgi:hypothetical protein